LKITGSDALKTKSIGKERGRENSGQIKLLAELSHFYGGDIPASRTDKKFDRIAAHFTIFYIILLGNGGIY